MKYKKNKKSFFFHLPRNIRTQLISTMHHGGRKWFSWNYFYYARLCNCNSIRVRKKFEETSMEKGIEFSRPTKVSRWCKKMAYFEDDTRNEVTKQKNGWKKTIASSERKEEIELIGGCLGRKEYLSFILSLFLFLYLSISISLSVD